MTCATLNFFPSKHKCASSQHSDKNGGIFYYSIGSIIYILKEKLTKKISYGFLLFELDFPKLNFCIILEPSVWDLEDLGSTQFSHCIQILHILSKTFQKVHKFFIFFLTYFRSFHPSSPNNTFHSVHIFLFSIKMQINIYNGL